MTEGISLSSLNRPAINMNNTEVGNNPNDKASGEEYFDRRGQQQENEEFRQSSFVDRSAQLRATLNSLAALNAASVVLAKNKYKNKKVEKPQEEENKLEEDKKVEAISSEKEEKQEDKK